MELHDLKPASGSKKKRKRLGRGVGTGLGKTSGRGHKGAGQRSGSKRRHGHEGGQMPLYRRIPKRGFTNIFKKQFQIVNLADLSRCNEGTIDSDALKAVGLIKKIKVPVKVLANGKVEKVYTVKANAFSKQAIVKIEAAGGKAMVI